MGGLKTIVIERMSNGYVVEDFWNEKKFCRDEKSVISAVKKALMQWDRE